MNFIERLGRGLLLAAVTPAILAEEVRAIVGMRGEVDTLRDAVARLKGQRDEAQRRAEYARSVWAGEAKTVVALREELRGREMMVSEAKRETGKRERALGEERAAHAKTKADLLDSQGYRAARSSTETEIRRLLSCGDYVDIVKAVEDHVAALVEAQEKLTKRDGYRHTVGELQRRLDDVADALGGCSSVGVVAHAAAIMDGAKESKRAAIELQAEVDKARAERDAAERLLAASREEVRALRPSLIAPPIVHHPERAPDHGPTAVNVAMSLCGVEIKATDGRQISYDFPERVTCAKCRSMAAT
jgi:hypothetical protein